MWLSWRFCSVINVHRLLNIPQKLICPLKKRTSRLDRHAGLLQITGSHLRAVRKAVEHLRFSLGGWLHVVDTFASSKMRTDKLNMCENVCAVCGKTPLLPLKRFPPPLKDYNMFWGPLSVEQLLQQPVVNKWLGLDAQKTVAMCSAAPSALHQTRKKALQETTNQEPLHSNKYDRNSAAHYLSSKTHSLSVSSNEHEQCTQSVHCAAEQEAVPLNWG